MRIAKNMSAESSKSSSGWRRSAARHWTGSVHRCNKPDRTAAVFQGFLLSALCVFLAGCAAPPGLFRDIRELEQDNTSYLDPENADSLVVSGDCQKRLENRFDSLYFAVWNRTRPRQGRDAASWGFTAYSGREVYAENRQPPDSGWFGKLEKNAWFETYPNSGYNAITTANTDLRVLPTHKPLFFNFELPGEGYPFDYMQNASLAVNTPIRVVHVSMDGAWLLADSHVALGWIPARDAAAVDLKQERIWKKGPHAVILEDEFPVRSRSGDFLFKAPFGSIFPIAESDSLNLFVWAAVPDSGTNAVLRQASVPLDIAAVKPLPLTRRNIANAANRLLGEPYGWGGLYQNRDCSGMIKDLFAPFGIWLPRHSADQAKSGIASLDLAGFSDDEKEAVILAKGVPYLTLLWLKGHIMLYIGRQGRHPVVFHNMWGIRTRSLFGKEGRRIVGKAVITTLTPGRELRNADGGATHLRRIEKMTFLVPQKPSPRPSPETGESP